MCVLNSYLYINIITHYIFEIKKKERKKEREKGREKKNHHSMFSVEYDLNKIYCSFARSYNIFTVVSISEYLWKCIFSYGMRSMFNYILAFYVVCIDPIYHIEGGTKEFVSNPVYWRESL